MVTTGAVEAEEEEEEEVVLKEEEEEVKNHLAIDKAFHFLVKCWRRRLQRRVSS